MGSEGWRRHVTGARIWCSPLVGAFGAYLYVLPPSILAGPPDPLAARLAALAASGDLWRPARSGGLGWRPWRPVAASGGPWRPVAASGRVLAALAALAARAGGPGGFLAASVAALAASLRPPGDPANIASVGTAAGVALCGNVGAEELRNFNVLSTVCGWTSALERLSAQGLGSCLTDVTVSDLADGVTLRVVPVMAKHCKHRPEASLNIWAIEGEYEITVGDQDEWMYQRERANAANPFLGYNQAADAYLRGDWGAAASSRQLAAAPPQLADELRAP
eukprot:gene15665-biopygen10545